MTDNVLIDQPNGSESAAVVEAATKREREAAHSQAAWPPREEVPRADSEARSRRCCTLSERSSTYPPLLQSVQHSDVTSHELIQSLRSEAVELQLQKDALQYTLAMNSQNYHTLLSTITQAVALEHQHHERACVRLLELQPMWRELQSANFAAPPDDVLVWIAANVPDVPPSLTRAISQRFLSGGSPRGPASSRQLKSDSGPNSANGSPRSGALETVSSSLKLSPRQLEKQPAPPPGPQTRGLEPVADPARPPSRRLEPIESPARYSATIQPSRNSIPPTQAHAPPAMVPPATVLPPSTASPRSTGSDLGSRHALHRRIVDLETTLRDVRTALEKLQNTTSNEELKGALGNVILLAMPPSPRSLSAVHSNLSLSPAPLRSSITVPATPPRHSRSGKRLSVPPTDGARESAPLVALLSDMPALTAHTPTFLRLTQMLSDLNKASAAPSSPALHRSSTGIPAAPSTALQLHKGKSALENGQEPPRARQSVGQTAMSGANPLFDVLSQLLAQIKLESESAK